MHYHEMKIDYEPLVFTAYILFYFIILSSFDSIIIMIMHELKMKSLHDLILLLFQPDIFIDNFSFLTTHL